VRVEDETLERHATVLSVAQDLALSGLGVAIFRGVAGREGWHVWVGL
jgi:hypothetical protein